MNDSVKSVVSLVVICLVVTLALSAVNYFTAPVIAENNAKAVQGSFAEALPGADGFEELEPAADAPETVKSIYKENNGLGYVVTLETTSQYSESPMGITVGIGTDGIIKNIVLTNYAETKNFGDDYPASYIGQDSALAGVELVSGVTYSSTAFRNAVTDAYTALFAVADVAAGEMSDDQMAAEAIGELLPSSLDNTGACKVEENDGLFVSSNRTGYAMVAERTLDLRTSDLSAMISAAAIGVTGAAVFSSWFPIAEIMSEISFAGIPRLSSRRNAIIAPLCA